MIAPPLAFGHVDREAVLGQAPQDAHGAHDTEMLSDAEFLEQFDAGTLDLRTFDHEAHFRAAWLCLRAAPFRDAVGRLRRGLKRLAISAGQPQRYHETITVAYTRLIHRQMRLLNDPPWEEFKARSAELLAPDMAALRALYGAGDPRRARGAQDLRAAAGLEHRAGRALPARVHRLAGGSRRTPARRHARGTRRSAAGPAPSGAPPNRSA